MKNKFLKSSMILLVGEILTKMIGVLYLIPLYKLNPEIGSIMANLFIPYSFILIFAALGINNVMTNEVSKYYLNDKKKLTNSLHNGFFLTAMIGLVLTILMYFLSSYFLHIIAPTSIYLDELIIGSKILASGVILFALTNFMRAVLLGFGEFKVVSLSYLLEQVIKVLVILLGSYYVLIIKNSNISEVINILSYSVIISISVTLLLFVYIFYSKKYYKYFLDKFEFNFKKTNKIAMAGMIFFLNGIFITLFDQFDLFMMYALFEKANVADIEHIKGIYFNWSFKLILIPISLSTAFITVMIRQFNEKKQTNRIFVIVYIYSLLMMSCVITMANQIYPFIYSYDKVGISLLRVQSILIPLYIMRTILTVYMILLKKEKLIIYNTSLLILLKIILNIIAINLFPSIYSFVLTSALAIIIATFTLYLSMRAEVNKKIYEYIYIFLKFIVIICIVIYITQYIYTTNLIILLLVKVVFIVVLFILLFYRDIKKIIK